MAVFGQMAYIHVQQRISSPGVVTTLALLMIMLLNVCIGRSGPAAGGAAIIGSLGDLGRSVTCRCRGAMVSSALQSLAVQRKLSQRVMACHYRDHNLNLLCIAARGAE